MEQIDKVAPESAAMDTSLEAEIASQRKVESRPAAAAPVAPESAAMDTSLEAEIAHQRKVESRPAAAAPVNGSAAQRFCTNCGHPLEPSHKFCANCGTPVAVAAPADGEKV